MFLLAIDFLPLYRYQDDSGGSGGSEKGFLLSVWTVDAHEKERKV